MAKTKIIRNPVNGYMLGTEPAFTPSALWEKFLEYRIYCENKQPIPKLMNIAGFCAFADITRETYYNYSENPAYFDSIRKLTCYLEDSCIQDRSTMGIFILKNKFAYKDKQEVDTTVTGDMLYRFAKPGEAE